ncbi:MAG TPA: glutamyl aminopeptidase, partial [Atopostipes sp.]|nr:glutamyl aminopeptidase [Atopostipes sp.]
MDDKRFELIKKLTETQSVSGFEHNIREVIRDEMTPYVDEIQQDGLGGIFGIRDKKDAPTIMVAAHMDEVG